MQPLANKTSAYSAHVIFPQCHMEFYNCLDRCVHICIHMFKCLIYSKYTNNSSVCMEPDQDFKKSTKRKCSPTFKDAIRSTWATNAGQEVCASSAPEGCLRDRHTSCGDLHLTENLLMDEISVSRVDFSASLLLLPPQNTYAVLLWGDWSFMPSNRAIR